MEKDKLAEVWKFLGNRWYLFILAPLLTSLLLQGLIDVFPVSDNTIFILTIVVFSIFPIYIVVFIVIGTVYFSRNTFKYRIIKHPFTFSSYESLSQELNNNILKKGYYHMHNSQTFPNGISITGYVKPITTHIYDFVFLIRSESLPKESFKVIHNAIRKISKESIRNFDKVYRHRYSTIFYLDRDSKLSDEFLYRKAHVASTYDYFTHNIHHPYAADDIEYTDNYGLFDDQSFQPIVVNLTDKKVSIPYRITKKGKEITCSIRDDLLEILNIDISIHRHTIANGEYLDETKAK